MYFDQLMIRVKNNVVTCKGLYNIAYFMHCFMCKTSNKAIITKTKMQLRKVTDLCIKKSLIVHVFLLSHIQYLGTGEKQIRRQMPQKLSTGRHSEGRPRE
jgi:hypothetical protein